MLLRVVLVACIFTVIGILSGEIQGWRAGTKMATRVQKVLRVSSATVMVIILGMILAGDGWIMRDYGPFGVMAYWTICFALTSILIIIALFDLREVGLSYGAERRRILKDLAEQNGKDIGEQ